MKKSKHIQGIVSMLICSLIIVGIIGTGSSPVKGRNDFSDTGNEEIQALSVGTNSYTETVSEISGEAEKSEEKDTTSASAFVSGGEVTGEIVPVTDSDKNQRFVPVISGNTVTDKLQNLSSENLYTFSVNERGTVSYTFSHYNIADISYSWRITLYQKFSLDGDGKNIKYREIYTEYSTQLQDDFTTLDIGVYPGDYRISVVCEKGNENCQYNLCVNFNKSYDYECECNDTLTRYNEITMGKTYKGSGAKLIDGNDRDCFMFTVTQSGYVNMSFLHDDLHDHTAAYRIYIYDAYGNEYYYTVSLMSDILVSSGNIALTPGYYFVEIDTHIFCNSDYWLTVQFTKDNMFETENNDIKANADELKPGIEIYGNLSQRSDVTDKDWYRFTLSADSSVIIDFIHSAQIKDYDGWNIELYDSDGNMMYSAVSKWTDSVIQSPFLGLSAGTYYININSDSLYLSSLTYAVLVINTTNGIWEKENNNTFEKANLIDVNTEINGTLTENGVDYDTDCYKFTMNESKEVSLDFSHSYDENNYEGWIITLYDNDKKELLTFGSKWCEQQKSSDKITLSEGTYYVKVDTGLYYSHLKYTLTVNKENKTDIEIRVDP